jgi:pSer/pThr/pTyr-binding forkhead associated (FHA) protein
MTWEKNSETDGKFGTLMPVGGGDPIPLLKDRLTIGRREGCDIALKFANISGQHCRFTVEHGYWFARDLGSRNGTKVDGQPIVRKRLDPNCKISFAKHEYFVIYDPQDLGAFGPPPADDDHMEELMKSSLLDRAGISRRSATEPSKNRKNIDF